MSYKLSDICSYNKEKTNVSKLNVTTYISTENMQPNKNGVTEATNLPTTAQTQAFSKGDVLVSNIRPYFKKIWQASFEGGCSNDVLVFRAKEGIDSTFLYYVLANDKFFNYSMATSKGTKMPRGDKTAIMEYEVPEFSVEIQRKVASVLKAIDDKIILNTEINKNLQAQAQAIYTSLFISNFNPKWEMGVLSDIIAIKYGKDHKKLEDGIYPVYGSGGIMRYVEKPLYTGESVLIPRKGTLNNVMYVNGAFWSVDTMFYTEMLRPNIAKFVYHFMKAKDLASLNAGSAVPSMTTNILNAMQVRLPDDETLLQFEHSVAPMYEMMQENNQQSATLASLRDVLLPKLMSDELDITEINF